MASDNELIAAAVSHLQDEVPKLAKLKLVFGLELTAGGLMGPAETDRFRVELPGPKVGEGPADDARLALSIPRTMFELLAKEGALVDWREAFYFGHLKVEGDRRVMKLIGQVIGSS
jgi:hypothetical protein